MGRIRAGILLYLVVLWAVFVVAPFVYALEAVEEENALQAAENLTGEKETQPPLESSPDLGKIGKKDEKGTEKPVADETVNPEGKGEPGGDVAAKPEGNEEPVVDETVKTESQEGLSEEEKKEDDEAFEKEMAEETATIADPLKPYNRFMFEVNDKLYFYLLKPISQVYKAILPEPVRVSIRNVLSNLATPVRLINCLLQGKFEGAAIEYSRFIINTTAGLLGIFDVAKKYNDLEKQDEDFGQTLGFYGVGAGFYIVWPFFGPSTLRDTVGMAGDFFADPLLYVGSTRDYLGIANINSDNHTAVTVTQNINDTSLTLGTYEEFKESSLDPYISMRDAYFNYRRNMIKK